MTDRDSRIKYIGYLDRIRVDGETLDIEGWAASLGAGGTTGLQVTASGTPCRILEQLLQLPSPDVRTEHPSLDDADRCRFRLRVTLPESLPSSVRDRLLVIGAPSPMPGQLLSVEPIFAQGRGELFCGIQASIRDVVDDMIPDYSVASYVGDAGVEQFKVVGRMMLDWFKTYCDLKPEEIVLEVGCGIGRIAVPLTQYITTGRYEGFDIVPHGIDWCREKITPRYPNFHFFLADVYNKHYQPGGKQAAADYRFPFEGGTFDFVFLTSVFTHMLPKDVEHYAAEIGRVLRPGGRCFCTIYSISEEALRQLASGSSRRAFKAFPEGYWSDTPDDPEAAIAYPEKYLTELFKQCGLETMRVIPGEWWKHEFTQDILVSRKV